MKNYTLRFNDQDKFYFAGFMRTAGQYVATGCPVIVKRYTKEEALKIKERFIKYHGKDEAKTIRIVKVGK